MAAIAADEECSSDSEADVSDDGVAEDGVGNAISPKPIGKKEKKESHALQVVVRLRKRQKGSVEI